MNRIKKLFAWSSTVALLGMGVSVAFAQSTPGTTASAPVIASKGALAAFLCNIINYFIWILIILSVIMVLVAAFDYITAGDDTEKTTRGRKRLTYAAVGIAIAIIAYGIPLVVESLIPGVTPTAVSCSGS